MSARVEFTSGRAAVATCLLLSVVTVGWGAKSGPIRKLTLDDEAPVVELFDGVEKGVFEVRVAARDEFDVQVFVTNASDKPLTVALPPAVAAVQVLKQFQPLQGPALGDQDAGQGSAQSVGGPVGALGNSGFPGGPGNNAFPGNNFFSIPPEKTVQLEMQAVCLDHGQRPPSSKMTYVLRRLEDHIDGAVLRRLLRDFDAKEFDRLALQAAAWHLRGEMTWDELRAERKDRLGGTKGQRYFTDRQLEQAQELVESAREKAVQSPRQAPTGDKKL